MKLDQASLHLNAISSYSKRKDGIEDLIKKDDKYDSFVNLVKQSTPINNNLIANNTGIIKWVGENIDHLPKKIRDVEKVTKKAIIKEASIADMVVTLSEADMAIQTIVTIRDKLLAAYQDIIKMQI